MSGQAPRIAIVDHGMGNRRSVEKALEHVGARAEITREHARLREADGLILPGVGAFPRAMANMRELGLDEILRELAAAGTPLLGICLGMQLLFEHSEEGAVDCLGLLPGIVTRMPPAPGLRIPHMGWNQLEVRRPSALLDGIADGAHAYFVHSFAAPVGADCVAASAHGTPFAAVVERGRVAGAQFHPERSAAAGARILENFLRGTLP